MYMILGHVYICTGICMQVLDAKCRIALYASVFMDCFVYVYHIVSFNGQNCHGKGLSNT